MKIYLGPELTERQERQREETEAVAKFLKQNGYKIEVIYLWAGKGNPSADSAMITVLID